MEDLGDFFPYFTAVAWFLAQRIRMTSSVFGVEEEVWFDLIGKFYDFIGDGVDKGEITGGKYWFLENISESRLCVNSLTITGFSFLAIITGILFSKVGRASSTLDTGTSGVLKKGTTSLDSVSMTSIDYIMCIAVVRYPIEIVLH